MQALGFPTDWLWRPMVILVGFVLAFYLGAGLILQFWKREMQISRARPGDSDDSAGKEKITERSAQDIRTVDIRLHDYGLDIEKRKWWGGKSKTLAVLQPVSTHFQPGVLNVVMGPSGSGKTTLLNSMARRLQNDFTTRYRIAGHMLFNGAVPSEDVIQSICSFVTQHDDALLPSLTVRETLK